MLFLRNLIVDFIIYIDIFAWSTPSPPSPPKKKKKERKKKKKKRNQINKIKVKRYQVWKNKMRFVVKH